MSRIIGALNVSQSEKKLMILLREKGKTYRQIKQRTGRSRTTILNVLNTTELTGNRKSYYSVGVKGETIVKNKLESLGMRVKKMPREKSFDLLVNGCEVDVKTVSYKYVPTHYQWSVYPNSGWCANRPPRDYYIFVALDIMNIWIIPSSLIMVKTLSISENSKWNEYLFKFDQLEVAN